MSRTRHHRNQRRQHMGHDYWSRRGGGNCHYQYGPEGRHRTAVKERALKDQLLSRVIKAENYETNE